ncbi:hypothetical protein C8J57DRAFT_1394177 [Mycena rebaudengoi]|nr:hypothetical protein C8J57DRAFT_1402454 [Mycena rebaudengoi]KAJ7219652.1 hypothetical protein C8J57DRAFT_1394177 [Mycena rebaudengoi]
MDSCSFHSIHLFLLFPRLDLFLILISVHWLTPCTPFPLPCLCTPFFFPPLPSCPKTTHFLARISLLASRLNIISCAPIPFSDAILSYFKPA